MDKWEYKLIDTKKIGNGEKGLLRTFQIPHIEEVEAYLSKLGDDGWEIINIDFDSIPHAVNSFVGIAKRKKS